MKLTIKNITKKYNEKMVLKNFSLDLEPGIYGLLGSNGSGKTTLMNIICGIIKPTTGGVYYLDKNINIQQESYCNILGFLPQNFKYYDDFSAIKFMMYIATLKGISKDVIRQKSELLLKTVGLEDVKNKKIKKYSGGMKQRLGIAQVLLNDPKIIVLDEPTVGLDPSERIRFKNILSSLSTTKIILLSTHIVSDVEYIADEILILQNGSLIDKGTSNQLLKKIEGFVWEGSAEPSEIQYISQNYIVGNQKYFNGDIILRIISENKPSEKYCQVIPRLEDLYLYYFQKETLK